MTTATVAKDHHNDTRTVTCHGLNHHDIGELAHCDGCSALVYRVLDDNNRVRKIVNWQTFSNGREGFYCFNPAHVCNPETAALKASEDAARIANGEIVKGAPVTVVRGRKVPKGTSGVVFWVGEDDWGKAKVGFRTESGDRVFTAASNVEVVSQ